MKPKLYDDVLRALAEADRAPGWNNRSREIRRYEVGLYGLSCTLFVVPFRRWAYRRIERQAEAWRAKGAQA
ncbi:MAG: hypothetical protein P4L92_04130 [Rudaea sp.]|nr:hypothetical protein [Rudaea sp.]